MERGGATVTRTYGLMRANEDVEAWHLFRKFNQPCGQDVPTENKTHLALRGRIGVDRSHVREDILQVPPEALAAEPLAQRLPFTDVPDIHVPLLVALLAIVNRLELVQPHFRQPVEVPGQGPRRAVRELVRGCVLPEHVTDT